VLLLTSAAQTFLLVPGLVWSLMHRQVSISKYDILVIISLGQWSPNIFNHRPIYQ
jgi:hypothetical protein